MAKNSYIIPNQIFVGLPWKNVRRRYEQIIHKLENKYPLYFAIVGRDDGQNAEDLLNIIKQRIDSSSFAIFDATGGNANVSLEYGYAEGKDIERAIFLSEHKAAAKNSAVSPIISDLTGRRRVQYKNEKKLKIQLDKLCRDHNYTKRFEKALSKILKGKAKGKKKSARTLAIKVVRALDKKTKVRRADLIQSLQAKNYKQNDVDHILKKLNSAGLIECTVGRYSDVSIA